MSDPTSRALSLLGLLQTRPFWEGEQLAVELGVTIRTLRRDIARLRDLGYMVDAVGGLHGGYRLGRGGPLPPLTLDQDQAVAVTLALHDAVAAGGPHADAALRALRTIQSIAPTQVRQRLEVLDAAAQTGIARRPAGAAAVDMYSLLQCAEAIHHRLRFGLDYTDRRGQRTSRQVEPHRLVPVRGRWMLVAFDLAREDWRTFRFDRLSKSGIALRRFAPRPGLDDVLARLDEPAPPGVWKHEVVVLIRAPLKEVVRTMPRLAGHLEAVGKAETEFRTGAEDPDGAAQWLVTLRLDFIVLGDDEVARAVERLARRLGCSTGQGAPRAPTSPCPPVAAQDAETRSPAIPPRR